MSRPLDAIGLDNYEAVKVKNNRTGSSANITSVSIGDIIEYDSTTYMLLTVSFRNRMLGELYLFDGNNLYYLLHKSSDDRTPLLCFILFNDLDYSTVCEHVRNYIDDILL